MLRKYGLSVAMFAMFAGSWLLQWLTNEHGWKEFWNATAENWQSEAWQMFWFILLSAWLIHKGSPQSKDGDEEMQRKLDEILRRLKDGPA